MVCSYLCTMYASCRYVIFFHLMLLGPYTGIKCTSNSSSRSTSPHTFIPSPKTIIRTPVASPKNTK